MQGLSIYLIPAGLIFAWYFSFRLVRERKSLAIQQEERAAGLVEPASLHPSIDPGTCVGCSACVTACPENNVLGIIQGKASLIAPAHCIGHGACAAACPMDAISLVFGTATRGVDIPHINADFETNIPGIYIAGELGGMGLIRNAVTQGRQAVESIHSSLGKSRGRDRLDLVIVGAGPAGFAASLAAKERGLHFVTLEQEALGGAVAHYPRGKIVMTAPVDLPLIGKMDFKETNKEVLLDFLKKAEHRAKLRVRYQERAEAVEPDEEGFCVQTQKARYKTRTLLLAIGRRGTPRKLGVPGEDHCKVVYRLIDAEQYRGKHVLVVGGGDSALEAAVSIAEQPGTQVALSYRGESFNRAKQKNRNNVNRLQLAGDLNVLLHSNIISISESTVELEQGGRPLKLSNDALIVCAGGVLPTGFLKTMGIVVETKYGTV
jgi:thioredoxin reductase/Pyruvate/2-oxoacid:ferredoxin oxidoreductase delta subunit